MASISVSISSDKIDRSLVVEKGGKRYLNLRLIENKDGPDQYGNDGFVVQDVPKERRAEGERGPIVGNWKDWDRRKDNPNPRPQQNEPRARPGDAF